jgi:signal transduction histidine kinase/ActR/RegA family two-component response regulator
MKIRAYLLIFALAILLPMIAFAVIAVIAFDRQKRAAVERGGVETARALMSAVDRELAGSVTTLRALATTRSLERGDLAAFHEDARRLLAGQPGWVTIILIAPSGTRVIDATIPFGQPLPPLREGETVEEVVRTAGPAIGPVTYSPLRRVYAVPVRVPVMRNGAVAYVLTGVVETSAIGALLGRQKLPPDWVGTVFDAKDNVAARTRGPEEFVGRPISTEFRRLLATSREGWAITHTLEGAPVYTAYSRSPATGWGVGLGIPAVAIDAPLRRSLWTVAGGGAALLVASVAASILVGRRIARPITALSTAARTFDEPGETPFAVPRQGPAEVVAAARAFVEGRALLRARDAERDAAERERARLLQSEQKARAEAEAANRAKDEFLAVLSHELRTPLNAVYGWARMLHDVTRDPATMRRGLEAIERNASAQVRLVEDLLDVSRIVTGQMRLDVRAVDLPAVINAALDSVRPAAQAKDIRLDSHQDPGVGPVAGDPDRLQQVVWNLAVNAVKFTPAGGRVRVVLRRAGNTAEIEVSDTGRGIGADMLPHVFDRFRQADSTTTRAHGGLGLGLALARHLVELHGGTVKAASPGPDQGATFTVTLPMGRGLADGVPGDEAVAAAPSVPRSPRAGALAGLRVLLLDDAPDSLELLSMMLGDAGATLRTCTSVRQALAAVAEFRPDVVLADIEMPGEDGYAFIRALRGRPPEAGGQTPAAAVTAYDRAEDRRRALAAGFDRHCPKPVDPAEIVAVVATLAAARAVR